MSCTYMDFTEARAKLHAFFETGTELYYKKRSVILGFAEGPDRAFWVTKGRVGVTSSNSEGVERTQHIYEEKELFPVKWIFQGEQHDVAFVALTDVAVRTKSLTDFKTFITEQPDTMLAIINQQIAVFAGLVNLHYETAEQKIAFRLLTLTRRFCTCVDKHPTVNCPVTVQELASTIRVSRETTGRVLNKFEKQGLVILQRQNIVAYPEKLKKFLEDSV